MRSVKNRCEDEVCIVEEEVEQTKSDIIEHFNRLRSKLMEREAALLECVNTSAEQKLAHLETLGRTAGDAETTLGL